MSIQGNINQIISLSGLLASQHPGIRAAAQKRSDLRNVTNKLKTIEDRIALGHDLARTEGAPGQLAPAYQERADLLRERYKLEPSIESWDAYKQGQIEARERADVENAIKSGKISVETIYGPEDKEAFMTQLEEQYDEYMYRDAEPETAASEARAKADASLTTEQTNRRETRDRTKGFTSQRYGTWGRTDNKAFKGGSR